MEASPKLLLRRRFLPIFVTQFLGAFNDNLFRTAMVMLVIYGIYRDATQEATFSAVAGGLFILPFFLLSALAGQLADSMDKARIVRIVKTAEIVIMVAGAAGLLLHNIPLLLLALCAMGVHSTFFGPIKYAILPQHLHPGEVLGGTGLVEAGTYIGILGGTLLGGVLVLQRPDGSFHAEWAAVGVLVVALIGRIAGQFVPPAHPDPDVPPFKMDWHIVRASNTLVRATLHIPRLFLAILAISFFWAMGAVLAAQFPPLVKNALGADQTVATLFLAIFSVGVALGSVAVNRLLGGQVSARYSPASALLMGLFVLDLYRRVKGWPAPVEQLRDLTTFLAMPGGWMIVLDLLGVAIAGGMFVVPLYAFLTTTVPPSETARTVAANNIVNSGFMVAATLVLTGAVILGVTVADSLLIVAVSSVIAAWLGWKLHLACD
ncbi:MFS transporter [Sphingomonas sp. LY29]|uniref:MFS transporter n=1 Tax=unclassified Sphingomonas TaxID=196159 RepID=UPI002ADEADEA|nr:MULTISPECIES: MFS transporter [unclassified Sphingomonas]MEA1073066.1 MFS transporter [Sphingomonas sp. LY160]WRP26498.1 MFS transporter [Sphingomonas sp. LY29]